jgi:hypothetical protein
MIIKTLSRKGNGFDKAISYVDKNQEQTEKSALFDKDFRIYHNIIGNTKEDAIQAFKENYQHKKKRRNGISLHHEILSFHKSSDVTQRAIEDLSQKYIDIRAKNAVVYGAVHTDKKHIHCHLIISANEVGSSKSIRLNNRDFKGIRIELEEYQQRHYPELHRSLVYLGREQKRSQKREDTNSRDQKYIELQKRLEVEATNKKTRKKVTDKEKVYVYLYQAKERAKSLDEFYQLVEKQGLTVYERKQKKIGVTLKGRNYRFTTALGKENWRKYLKEIEHLKRLEAVREQQNQKELTREERLAKARERGKGKDDLGRVR